MVFGQTSCGKTTLIKKCLFDWAEQKDSKFKLLLPVKLRLVQVGASLLKTITDQMELTEQQNLILEWILRKNPEEVLFLFDGLDEYQYMLRNSQEISDILKGKKYRSSSYIMTTRTEYLPMVMTWQKNKSRVRKIEIQGFGKNEIENYIKKFFSDDECAEELIKELYPDQLKARNHSFVLGLQKLAQIPGELCLLCLLYSKNKRLPQLREKLYEEVVQWALKRFEERCTKDTRSSSKKIVGQYSDLLLKYGEVACSDYGTTLQVTFSEQEILIVRDFMATGFLTKWHPKQRTDDSMYQFIHKSVQEYLAAFYISHCENPDRKLAELIGDETRIVPLNISLLRFVMYFLTASQNIKLLQRMVKHNLDRQIDREILVIKLMQVTQGFDKQTEAIPWKGIMFDGQTIIRGLFPSLILLGNNEDPATGAILTECHKQTKVRLTEEGMYIDLHVPEGAEQIRVMGTQEAKRDGMFNKQLLVYCHTDHPVGLTLNGKNLKKITVVGICKLTGICADSVMKKLQIFISKTAFDGEKPMKDLAKLSACTTLTHCLLTDRQVEYLAECLKESGNILNDLEMTENVDEWGKERTDDHTKLEHYVSKYFKS